MLSNDDIQKLLAVLASKEDLKDLATKEELSEVKEELKNLATKEDLKSLATKEDLNRVEKELKNLNEKVDEIAEFTHILDEDTNELPRSKADGVSANAESSSVSHSSPLEAGGVFWLKNKRLKRVEKHLNLPPIQT